MLLQKARSLWKPKLKLLIFHLCEFSRIFSALQQRHHLSASHSHHWYWHTIAEHTGRQEGYRGQILSWRIQRSCFIHTHTHTLTHSEICFFSRKGPGGCISTPVCLLMALWKTFSIVFLVFSILRTPVSTAGVFHPAGWNTGQVWEPKFTGRFP